MDENRHEEPLRDQDPGSLSCKFGLLANYGKSLAETK
jgi:hypothetical protein